MENQGDSAPARPPSITFLKYAADSYKTGPVLPSKAKLQFPAQWQSLDVHAFSGLVT